MEEQHYELYRCALTSSCALVRNVELAPRGCEAVQVVAIASSSPSGPGMEGQMYIMGHR